MAKKEVSAYSQQTFESIKHADEIGNEFWYARELQRALEYREWRNFEKSLEKAKSACESSGIDKNDHFVDVNKMVSLGSGSERKIADVKLSRYACYLIVMNGDPRKEVIALGQAYFAVGKKVRQTIAELGGTMPENLPTPEKSAKVLKNERAMAMPDPREGLIPQKEEK